MVRSPRYGHWIALALAGLAGAAVARQARYNGELGTKLEDPYLAGFISCTVGIVLLFIVVLRSPQSRARLTRSVRLLRTGSLPLWLLTGGFSGAFLVLAQSAATHVL